MKRSITAVVLAGVVVLAACGSDAEPAASQPATSAPLSTENAGSEFCVTFAALDASAVFLHGGESSIRPGLEQQIAQIEELQSSVPSELSGTTPALETRLAAAVATLDIYAANSFDAEAVSEDATYGDVSEIIGASLQADVVNATRETRAYCGIEL